MSIDTPAFPMHVHIQSKNLDNLPEIYGADQRGMTLRQYAAIKLRVPNSGIDELDEMIRESLRNEFAGQALAGIAKEAIKHSNEHSITWAREAYQLADAMLKAGGKS